MSSGSVIPYGRKTFVYIIEATLEFEGSVIPYGRKTEGLQYSTKGQFEGSGLEI